jgi:thymidylate synthase
MQQYLDLLRHVLENGAVKGSRPVLRSTGHKPQTLSVFAPSIQLRFNLQDGFPLVTTKRIPFKQVLHELIWFLSGSTNVAYLRKHGVKIWDAWADAEGELGPVYGKQWRRWQGANGVVVDQVARLLENIETVKRDPNAGCGRRLILTAWNPAEIEQMKGPPACHTFCQFNVTGGALSCQMYQRSADLFLGVPWNIASYALLTHLVAHVTGLDVGTYVHAFGDAHIYENHLEAVREQLPRQPYPLPRVQLDAGIHDLDHVNVDQVQLIGYTSHPSLSGEVAV